MKKALQLIKKWEGLKLKSYLCPARVWTIGYGHTKGVKSGQFITEATANAWLEQEVTAIVAQIEKSLGLVYKNLSQNQIDALTSFVYNLGIGNFNKSTLKKLIVQGDLVSAADEFPKWNKAGKKVLDGLTARREDERNLFISSKI